MHENAVRKTDFTRPSIFVCRSNNEGDECNNNTVAAAAELGTSARNYRNHLKLFTLPNVHRVTKFISARHFERNAMIFYCTRVGSNFFGNTKCANVVKRSLSESTHPSRDVHTLRVSHNVTNWFWYVFFPRPFKK